MSAPEIFALSLNERQSPLWQRLEAWLRQERQDRLESLASDFPERTTQMLRGEVAAFTTILDLAKDRPPQDG